MVFNVCSAGILLKDYVLKLMDSMCVLLEFVERLYVVIDGFNMCSAGIFLKDYVLKLMVSNAVIDGFQCVCSAGILLKDYVLKLMVSMCVFC